MRRTLGGGEVNRSHDKSGFGNPRSQASMSDLAIRNLFIIPTILFLIVFNIFPLIYSLGYSFTDFRASTNAPANFVGLQNYMRPAQRSRSSGRTSPSRRNTSSSRWWAR
jgi:ABC-type sugar transport system permease subunit